MGRTSKIISAWLILLLVVTLVHILDAAESDATILAKPGCKDTCGNVSIPFPFGIGPNCAFDHWFQLTCNSSNGSTKPFLSKLNIEVMEIYITSSGTFVKVTIPPMKECGANRTRQRSSSFDLRGSPYGISTQDNVFMMEGCPGSAVLASQSTAIMAGCGTVCHNNNNNSAIPTNSCYGVQCCQTLLPISAPTYLSSLQFYQISFNGQNSSSSDSRDCLVATVIEMNSVNQYVGKLSSSNPPIAVPVKLSWNLRGFEDVNNPRAICFATSKFTLCQCKDRYYGNPFLSNGCQVPQACKSCRGNCYGDWDMMTGRLTSSSSLRCEKKPLLKLAAILGLCIGFGILLLIVSVYGLFRFIKRRREIKQRAKFFKRNGGLLLQQQLSSNKNIVEKTKIFTVIELDSATDHFNKNRILGQGGQGTVYKGMLTDGRIVAIKKSTLLDGSQLEQFINEVVILSQTNHRNVVKLLGCCLETEVPLLVYEFVPNGTLYEHIHEPDEDLVISWEMRLKVAVDSAAAVAYLHSFSSVPIYHRDIKSSNILLDEKRIAKVSDFGSSKTIAIDQTHLTTLVQGTMGYLDPEYFQSYQFTEKSDVYSFGVVLLELLTSKKPIYKVENMEQKNLVTEFLYMVQNSRMSDILDPEIVKEAKEDELMAVVELAKRCVNWSGKLRPTMKEVAIALEVIMKSPAQASRWFQEQEALPIPDEGFDEYVADEISDT